MNDNQLVNWIKGYLATALNSPKTSAEWEMTIRGLLQQIMTESNRSASNKTQLNG
jgi:hypothetical protein